MFAPYKSDPQIVHRVRNRLVFQDVGKTFNVITDKIFASETKVVVYNLYITSTCHDEQYNFSSCPPPGTKQDWWALLKRYGPFLGGFNFLDCPF